jgi:anti-sigma regulatory factor (Ser/Thr protein kinase)
MAAPASAPLLRAARFDAGRLSMQLGNGLAAIAEGGAALRDFCAREGVSDTVINRIDVIFEEIVANIVRHGFDAGSAQSIEVVARIDGDAMVLVVDDDGRPFDPTVQPPPAPFTRLADAQVGGLGVALVQRLARSVAYAQPVRAGDGFAPVNRLTVTVATGERMPPG